MQKLDLNIDCRHSCGPGASCPGLHCLYKEENLPEITRNEVNNADKKIQGD